MRLRFGSNEITRSQYCVPSALKWMQGTSLWGGAPGCCSSRLALSSSEPAAKCNRKPFKPAGLSCNDAAPSCNDEVLSRNDEVLSRNDEALSRNDEVLSRKDEVLSRNDEVLSRNDEVLSRNDEALSCNNEALELQWCGSELQVSSSELKNQPAGRILPDSEMRAAKMLRLTGFPAGLRRVDTPREMV